MDDTAYAWVEPPAIGEILVFTHQSHKADHLHGTGDYHLLTVHDEPELSDHIHLELESQS